MLVEATVEGRTFRVEVSAKGERYVVSVDGRTLDVDWQDAGGPLVHLVVDGRNHMVGVLRRTETAYAVVVSGHSLDVELAEAGTTTAAVRHTADGPVGLRAPMPGKVVRVLVEGGQPVDAGQGLVVMEAMKMENELRSPRAGRVREIGVREGQAVETGTLLLVVE